MELARYLIFQYNFCRNTTEVWILNTLCVIQKRKICLKPTDALNSNFIGITTLHVSGSLSAHHQDFLAGFGTLYEVVMNRLLQEVWRNRVPSYSW